MKCQWCAQKRNNAIKAREILAMEKKAPHKTITQQKQTAHIASLEAV